MATSILPVCLIHYALASSVVAVGQGGPVHNKCNSQTVDDLDSRVRVNYIVTCRKQGLTRVPDNLPNTTVELYLDQNYITQVPPFAFSYMRILRVLDLSQSHVEKLSPNCFSGLNKLEELYLPFNNIMIPSNVASGLFASFSQLRILHVQGNTNTSYATWSREMENLISLQELGISYFSDAVFPSELASLSNLTNLQLSYGPAHNITSESLSTLRGGRIQELSFKHNIRINYIERGSFDDMPELRLLNFACCYNLDVDYIIDAVSNATNTRLTHLIVDGTNKNEHGSPMHGAADVVECRSVWRHLTHFSMQNCGVRFIHAAAVRCFQNLTAVSYGYSQLPLPIPYHEGMEILKDIGENALPKFAWQSVRCSYLQKTASVQYKADWGCSRPYNRLSNSYYFPDLLIGSVLDLKVSAHNRYGVLDIQSGKPTEKQFENEKKINKSNSFKSDHHDDVRVVFVPRNLEYIKIDNIGFTHRKSYFHLRFTSNNLLFVNMSSNPAAGPEMNGILEGLGHIRILDISRSGYKKLNPLLLEYLPSLTHLYASGNSLRQSSFTSLSKIRKLAHFRPVR